jgi:DNA-binding beta-propeller fold protein YncE
VAGFSGDGGDARAATMRGPKHIGVDREDNVLITDTENHAIRKYVAADGRMVLVAGTGIAGAAGVGGPPEALQLRRPHGTAVDAAGAIYIADSENHRLLRIERY